MTSRFTDLHYVTILCKNNNMRKEFEKRPLRSVTLNVDVDNAVAQTGNLNGVGYFWGRADAKQVSKLAIYGVALFRAMPTQGSIYLRI